MGRFDVGIAFQKTASVFFRNLHRYVGITLLIYSPAIAATFLGGSEEIWEDMTRGQGIASLLGFVLGPWITATVTYDVLERLGGRSTELGPTLAFGVRRIVPVFLVNFLLGLSVAVGFLFLIVPGLIVMTMFAVAIPACVVERPGVFKSMDRSIELTKGSRWGVFAVVLAIMMFYGLFGMVAGFAALASVEQWIVNLFNVCMTLVFAPGQAVVMSVIYHDLRTKTEGAEVTELTEVFS